MKFNGTDSYLEMTNISKIIDKDDDFTISLWILNHDLNNKSGRNQNNTYLNSAQINSSSVIYPGFAVSSDSRTNTDQGFQLEVYDEGGNNYDNISISPLSADDFRQLPLPIHVAVTRHESKIRMFLNGDLKHEFDYDHVFFNGGKLISGWHSRSGSIRYSDFTLDDICLIKGKALWISNFTPPATYLPDEIQI